MKALLIALLLVLVVAGCVSRNGPNATPTPYGTPVPTVDVSDSPPSPPAMDSSEAESEIDSGLEASQEQPPEIPADELTVTEDDLGA